MAVITLSSLLILVAKEIVIEVILDKTIDAAIGAFNNFQVDKAIQQHREQYQKVLGDFSQEYQHYTKGAGFDEIFDSVVQDIIDETVRRSDKSLGAAIQRRTVEQAIRGDSSIKEEIRSSISNQLRAQAQELKDDYIRRHYELAQQYQSLI